MTRYAFIFSDEPRYRLRRHIYFWLVWWLCQSFLYSFVGGILNQEYFRRLPMTASESFVYLLPHMFMAYSLMYFVVPKLLLKAKYLKAFMAAVVLFLVTGAFSSLISIYLISNLRLLWDNSYPQIHNTETNFFLGLLAGLRGATTVGGFAAAIKLMKFLYMKEQRNLQLQKEAISSQLQLLKAQVHPHFLFNTLNNIYSGAQVTSPASARMIMGLSELLRYMLYECNQPLVPLSRELKMLEQYILLEKSRYGNGLDINVEWPQTDTGLSIAPLLLLPFVENCFKHGTSNMLEQPWISLFITVEDAWLKMKLVNGKAEDNTASGNGIGLSNVKKRLSLLYFKKHELVVTAEEEIFIVNLKLLLEKTAPATILSTCTTTEQYA